MRLAGLLCCLFLVACGRPLTEAEERFAKDIFGPSLDTSKVVVAQGAGLLPPRKTVVQKITRLKGTENACVRVPRPRTSEKPPAQAFAFRNKIHFDTGLYSSDMIMVWPEAIRLPQAFIFAHELTHVWQWQNRDKTGYTPFRAAMESVRLADPYFAPPGAAPFFSFGYEQQAAMVEDYLCFAFANPNHPRRAELRAILGPVFDVDRIDTLVAP